ncbi:MAG TPA: hypothetical protein ENI62_05265 [Gammaproteobacteria bacterium]|nr:hypothetical protein [Gammaproteobacteria bacterium]
MSIVITRRTTYPCSPTLAWSIGLMLGLTQIAQAHEPIFTPGAHVHSKGGHELTLQYGRDRSSGAGEAETKQEFSLEYEYGITANWTIKAEAPLVDRKVNGNQSSGLGDLTLGTKYRFIRKDLPGQQFSTALLLQAKLPAGGDSKNPRLGSGSTDIVVGLFHGLESRRWYYNVAARYRRNAQGSGGLRKGDKVLLDLVGGVRPVLTKYKEPDTVLFLELNWEDAQHDSLNGVNLANTGGSELFISPGVFWTVGVYAITAGVQIPLAERLNGSQPSSDYRFKLTAKYEF